MVAAVVVADPLPLVNTARNFVPFWPAKTLGMVRVVVVAPATLLKVAPPSVENCHCTVGVGVPFAAAMNVAVWPAFKVASVGFCVMTGPEPAAVFVSEKLTAVKAPELAETLYGPPAVAFEVKAADATPVASVATTIVVPLLVNFPDAPAPGAVNVTLMPGVGLVPTSFNVTASATGKAVLTAVDWGVVVGFNAMDVGGPATIVVGSVAVGLLLAPPPDAVAELVIELVPTVTLLATLTVSVNACALLLGLTTKLYVHVTTCATAEHVQKFPIPDT
jgi:hypothetical protein